MNLQNKKILITGGDGFIGRHLVFGLKRLGAKIDIFDRNRGDDMNDYKKLEKILKKNYFAVYHLAGVSGAVQSITQERNFLNINTLASIKLAELLLEHTPNTKLIISSTRLEYGVPKYLPVDEQHPTFPISIYGLSKLAFTQIAMGFFAKWGLDITILRTSNVYGPHRKDIFKGYNVINFFVNLAFNNKTIQIFGDGSQLRDYLYIDDFVQVLIKALDKKSKGEIINIGFGKGISIKAIVKKIIRYWGKGKIKFIKWPKNYQLVESGSYITNIKKAQELLDFQPTIDFDEGIALSMNSCIKICSPHLGINPESILGGEIFDRQILLGLAEKGVNIEIILPFTLKHDDHKNWHITNLPIVHFPAILFNIFILPYLFILYKLRKFRIIRIHSPRYVGLGCLIFKMINPKVKLIATYHQFRETNFFWLSKIVNKAWDHIICDSENVKRELNRKYGISLTNITVVHNGVPSYLKPMPKNKQLMKQFKLQGKNILLYMGLFIDRKTPLFLIDVLKKLVQKDKNIILLMVGKGELEHQIISRAKDNGVFNNLRLIKQVFGEEKNQIKKLEDLFVFPSKDEGFALAPLEAMACGVPVIENNRHSAAEAVTNGKNGYLCQTDNINDWTNKINKILSDLKLRTKMSDNCLKRINKEFDWEQAVNHHIAVFKKLIS